MLFISSPHKAFWGILSAITRTPISSSPVHPRDWTCNPRSNTSDE